MLNKTLASQLQNPLTRERDQHNRARVLESFQDLSVASEEHALALRRYLDNRPEKFFGKEAYETYLRWLQRQNQKRPRELKAYLSQFDAEINRALLFLREINIGEWHDRPLSGGGEFEVIRMIDRHVHPAYLRLVEGVFTPLIRPVAHFSRLDRKKGVQGLDVWSITEEIKGKSEKSLIGHYDHIVRNGIAHGGISFLQREIRYRDQKGNEETRDITAVVRLFDDMLDICNGVAAAFKVFLLTSRGQGYVPPRELMVEALQEHTWAPWWTVEGCVEAEIAGRSQLIVYATPDSRNYGKVSWSTIQSGILSESLAPGYDRYFFSLRSRKALPGWAAFDGRKLRALREKGTDDLSRYHGIVEDDVVFYVPQPAMPKFLARIDTLATAVRLAISTAIQKMKDVSGAPRMSCRNATLHRNSWGAVLNGSVAVEGLDAEEMVRAIRENCGRIVKMGRKQARKEGGFCLATLLPTGYAQVGVFRRDYRRRRLSGFGLGDDLVCTVRLHRIQRIKAPDIIGSTIEMRGKWRIAWNKAWLDAVGHEVLESERN